MVPEARELHFNGQTVFLCSKRLICPNSTLPLNVMSSLPGQSGVISVQAD